MIHAFGPECALLLVDVQEGVDDLQHWGGPTGRRNNPQAETNLRRLLDGWRNHGLPVIYTRHDSREQRSPLKLSLAGGKIKAAVQPRDGETVLTKDVNSAFVGTNLEIMLRRRRIHRLVVGGFFTNMCVETSVRMAGNLGFDTYLIHDACSTSNRLGIDGTDYDPEVVHALSVASMHGEFCTAIGTQDALQLLDGSVTNLERRQGNE